MGEASQRSLGPRKFYQIVEAAHNIYLTYSRIEFDRNMELFDEDACLDRLFQSSGAEETPIWWHGVICTYQPLAQSLEEDCDWSWCKRCEPTFSDEDLIEYKIFLLCQRMQIDLSLSHTHSSFQPQLLPLFPTPVINNFWNSHLLRPLLYLQMCDVLFTGLDCTRFRVLDHCPEDHRDPEHIKQKRIEETLRYRTFLYASPSSTSSTATDGEDSSHSSHVEGDVARNGVDNDEEEDAMGPDVFCALFDDLDDDINGHPTLNVQIKDIYNNISAVCLQTQQRLYPQCAAALGKPCDTLRLIYRGRQLGEGIKVSDSGLEEGAQIIVLTKFRGDIDAQQ